MQIFKNFFIDYLKINNIYFRKSLTAILAVSRFYAFDVVYFFANKSTLMEFYFLSPNKYHSDKLSLIKMLTDGFNFSVLMQRVNTNMDGMI